MSRLYTPVPTANGPFAGIDPVARMTFGLIWDRYKLSSYHVTGAAGDCPWYDQAMDAVYCVYGQAELAAEVGVSERTIRRALDTLREAGLLIWRKATYKGSCRYYIPEHTRQYLRRQ